MLAAYHDGELAPADRARVDEHLRGCGECSAVLARLARVDANVDVPDPGPEYWERFNRRVMERVDRRGRPGEGVAAETRVGEEAAAVFRPRRRRGRPAPGGRPADRDGPVLQDGAAARPPPRRDAGVVAGASPEARRRRLGRRLRRPAPRRRDRPPESRPSAEVRFRAATRRPRRRPPAARPRRGHAADRRRRGRRSGDPSRQGRERFGAATARGRRKAAPRSAGEFEGATGPCRSRWPPPRRPPSPSPCEEARSLAGRGRLEEAEIRPARLPRPGEPAGGAGGRDGVPRRAARPAVPLRRGGFGPRGNAAASSRRAARSARTSGSGPRCRAAVFPPPGRKGAAGDLVSLDLHYQRKGSRPRWKASPFPHPAWCWPR